VKTDWINNVSFLLLNVARSNSYRWSSLRFVFSFLLLANHSYTLIIILRTLPYKLQYLCVGSVAMPDWLGKYICQVMFSWFFFVNVSVCLGLLQSPTCFHSKLSFFIFIPILSLRNLNFVFVIKFKSSETKEGLSWLIHPFSFLYRST
jgi:hypothetical protein